MLTTGYFQVSVSPSTHVPGENGIELKAQKVTGTRLGIHTVPRVHCGRRNVSYSRQ